VMCIKEMFTCITTRPLRRVFLLLGVPERDSNESKNMETQIKLDQHTLADVKKRSGAQTKQSVIALEMSLQEPAVSKIEKKLVANMQVEKLKRYIAALGGELTLTVTMPNGDVLEVE